MSMGPKTEAGAPNLRGDCLRIAERITDIVVQEGNAGLIASHIRRLVAQADDLEARWHDAERRAHQALLDAGKAAEPEARPAKEEWWISLDEEDWTNAEGPYGCWSEAATIGPGDLDLEPGEAYYVGRKVPFEPKIFRDQIIDQLAGDAWDHAREHVGEWPDVSPEQANELASRLTRTLRGFLREFGLEPTFFAVDKITQHIAPGESGPDES